jgi:poly(3-hydroxybutyrate) depolymerase
MKYFPIILSLIACLAGTPVHAQETSPRLPALGADLAQASVSGISSGGFMAAQIATAYSSTFMGVGVIAAGPWYCAGSLRDDAYLTDALSFCMTPASSAVGPDGVAAYAKAVRLAADGAIDPVAGVGRQRVYIFSGLQDRTVRTVVGEQAAVFYRSAGVTPDRLRFDRHPDAAHAIVTDRPDDLPCGAEEPPYINNCGFMQSHVLLAHIYPGKTAQPAAAPLGGRLLKFDQGEFLQGARTAMDRDAYAYIPAWCEANRCAVHVALHGCRQGRSAIGDRFYTGTGYNEFADTNGIIVLYPQVHAADLPPNPRGCWDFWGYSDRAAFPTRAAPQMRAIAAMVRRLGEARPALP